MNYRIQTPQSHPFRAIVLYGRPENIVHASSHDIEDGVLQEGKPLQYWALRGALNKLVGSKTKRYLLPPNVLYYQPNDQELLFYTPAMLQPHIYQHTFNKEAAKGEVFPNPALLWFVHGRRMRLFALDSEERPSQNSQLYHAPYFNTDANGVCVGSMPLLAQPEPTAWESYVQAFFLSVFTHPIGNKNYNYPGSFQEMWQEAKQKGYFPKEFLQPYITLEQAFLGAP